MGLDLNLDWFSLLVIALATWRLAHMIAIEHGPFKCFVWLRIKLPFGGVTTCVYCLSVWIGAAMLVAYHYIPEIVWVFAISGAALMLKAYTGVGRD